MDEGVKARAVLAVFTDLFSGGPDTSYRTVWDESQAIPALGVGPLECVSVPMADLRAAMDEAQRIAGDETEVPRG